MRWNRTGFRVGCAIGVLLGLAAGCELVDQSEHTAITNNDGQQVVDTTETEAAYRTEMATTNDTEEATDE